MDIDFDLFDSEPPVSGTGSRFKPKAKPLVRKDTNAIFPCNPPINAKDQHTSAMVPCNAAIANSLPEPLETQESTNNTKTQNADTLQLEGDIGSSPLLFSQYVTTEDNVYTEGLPQNEDAISNIIGDSADIFSELESFDDANVSSTVRKFQPNAKLNSRSRDKLPTLRPVTTDLNDFVSHSEATVLPVSNTIDLDGGSDVYPNFLVPQDIVNSKESAVSADSGRLYMDTGRMEREESNAYFSQATTDIGGPQIFETGYVDENLTSPDGLFDFSMTRHSDSAPVEIPVSEGSHLDGPDVNAATAEGVDLHSLPVISEKTNNSRKRKTSTRNICAEKVEGLCQFNEDGKSSRRLRKRLVTPVLTDDMEDDTQQSGDVFNESSDANNGDSDEVRGEEISLSKRAPKKSKKSVVENEKTVRRRKNVSKEPDLLNKELPKMKFSRSTRRNKRTVDKALLEMPEDELDVRNLSLKDLIHLAEAKERLWSKGGATSSNSVPNQSFGKSFAEDEPYYEDDPFASAQGLNREDDEAANNEQQNSPINYHSFMTKTPKERWTKQDTELFYEAIRQFGTDFAMIQQLFPGRTRHQVKLKYKKEERQHPLELSDALNNRSTSLSHFELVIKQLQEAAGEEEQSSYVDGESIGLTGQEEVSPETNEDVSKLDYKAEEGCEDLEQGGKNLEPEAPKVHNSPVKPQENEDVADEYEFDFSQYKSVYDDDED